MRGKLMIGASLGFLVLCLGLCAAWSREKQDGTEAAADAGEFTRLHARWTKLVKELRDLQVEFRLAAEKDREGLRAKFTEKLEQAGAMLPQVAAAGEAAFKANPKDAQLRDFIVALTQLIALLTDDHEQVLRLNELVIQNSPATDVVGMAAYGLAASAAIEVQPPKFDLAEKYLAQAAKGHVKVSSAIKSLRDKLPKEKQYWATEAAIRKAEEEAASDLAKALPRVLLKTNKGDIVLELFENEAPNTVANFISLVEKGFYDGLTFHRVIPQAVIQGGCPKGDGTGGPGYKIPCECYEMKNGKPLFRRHFRGSLSMQVKEKDTGGSQFFICLSAGDNVRNLDAKFTSDNKPDGGHTVFGRVVTGFDVMAKIQRRNPQSQRPQDQDIRPDRIDKATVIRKRNHPYAPKKVGETEAKKDEKAPPKGTESKTEAKTEAKTNEKTKTGAKTLTDAKTPPAKS